MLGVNMAFHDAIRECFEGIMLEPCLPQPCFHVAGGRGGVRQGRDRGAPQLVFIHIHQLFLIRYILF